MKLPEGWQRDPLLRDETHARVYALLREGVPQREIALRTGVSLRGVGRLNTRRAPKEPSYCGVPNRDRRQSDTCTARVAVPGTHCRWHR